LYEQKQTAKMRASLAIKYGCSCTDAHLKKNYDFKILLKYYAVDFTYYE